MKALLLLIVTFFLNTALSYDGLYTNDIGAYNQNVRPVYDPKVQIYANKKKKHLKPKKGIPTKAHPVSSNYTAWPLQKAPVPSDSLYFPTEHDQSSLLRVKKIVSDYPPSFLRKKRAANNRQQNKTQNSAPGKHSNSKPVAKKSPVNRGKKTGKSGNQKSGNPKKGVKRSSSRSQPGKKSNQGRSGGKRSKKNSKKNSHASSKHSKHTKSRHQSKNHKGN